MIYDGEEGLNAVMFPVERVNVYAETEPGKRDLVSGKKAIVNTDTREVLSVVSRGYHLLDNRRALDLAKGACRVAFPNTEPTSWFVKSVEAPRTGGHCRIDLHCHRDKGVAAYDWSFSQHAQDEYYPFLRVTNSYNTTRVFSIHFGFERQICENGMIASESIRISLAHVGNVEEQMKARISKAKFQKVADQFKYMLEPLRKTRIAPAWFLPMVKSVLKINKPKSMPRDRRSQWKQFKTIIDRKVDDYIGQQGENAYALYNVITDLATTPPGKDKVAINEDDKGYNFIRRERHSLQVLAGQWMADFSGRLRRKDFDLNCYVEELSGDLGKTSNGAPRRPVSAASP